MKISVSTVFGLQVLVSLVGVTVIVASLVFLNEEQATLSAEEKIRASLKFAEQRLLDPFRGAIETASALRNLLLTTPGTDCAAPEIRYSHSNDVMLPFTRIALSLVGKDVPICSLYQMYRMQPLEGKSSNSTNWLDFAWSDCGCYAPVYGPCIYATSVNHPDNRTVDRKVYSHSGFPNAMNVTPTLALLPNWNNTSQNYVQLGVTLTPADWETGKWTKAFVLRDFPRPFFGFELAMPVNFDPVTGMLTRSVGVSLEGGYLGNFFANANLTATEIWCLDIVHHLIIGGSDPIFPPGFYYKNASDKDSGEPYSIYDSPFTQVTEAVARLTALSPTGNISGLRGRGIVNFGAGKQDVLGATVFEISPESYMVALTITNRGWIFDRTTFALTIGITVGVVVFIVLALSVIALTLAISQPLNRVSGALLKTAQLDLSEENEGGKEENCSIVTEVFHLEQAYSQLRRALASFASYVPLEVVRDSFVETDNASAHGFSSALSSTLDVEPNDHRIVGVNQSILLYELNVVPEFKTRTTLNLFGCSVATVRSHAEVEEQLRVPERVFTAVIAPKDDPLTETIFKLVRRSHPYCVQVYSNDSVPSPDLKNNPLATCASLPSSAALPRWTDASHPSSSDWTLGTTLGSRKSEATIEDFISSPEDYHLSLPRNFQPADIQKLVSRLVTVERHLKVESRKKAEKDKVFSMTRHEYTLGPVVGKGKFANVHQVVDTVTGGVMAVKILSKTGTYKRFLTEIQLLFSLEHPNVVKYLRAAESPSNVFIYMELCLGSFDRHPLVTEILPPLILPTMLQQGSRTCSVRAEDSQKVFSIIRQLLLAVAYIHGRNIIHRDIKVGNLLVGRDGCTVKLGDFGVAIDKSKAGELVGTLAFMAPEVVRQEEYNQSCDIYSAGMIVILLLHWVPEKYIQFFKGKQITPPLLVAFFAECELPDEIISHVNETLKRVVGEPFSSTTNSQDCSLSSIACDFIRKLVSTDPQKRASAVELLDHPFLNLENMQQELPQLATEKDCVQQNLLRGTPQWTAGSEYEQMFTGTY